MKELIKALSLGALTLAGAQHASADAASISLGINGAAFEYTHHFNQNIDMRVVLSDMPIEADVEEEGIDYELEYDRTNLGLLVDYRPMGGSFYLTAGFYQGDHIWRMSSESALTYDVGDTSYTSPDLRMKVEAEFDSTSPYLGFGWGNSPEGSGFTANIDIGVLMIGSPDVGIDASGNVCSIDTGCITADDAAFQDDLEAERRELEDDLSDADILPVIQFGFGYKF